MDKQELQLLELFLKVEKDCLTSQELARELAVSDKTIRKKIGELNAFLLPHAQLAGVQGQGYSLMIEDPEEFYLFYHEQKQQLQSDSVFSNLTNHEEREIYLFSRLFFEQDRLDIASLKEKFFLSDSSWSKFLSVVRKKLAVYDLKLSRREGNFQLIGREKDKRRFIQSYFLSRQLEQPILSRLEDIPLFQDIPIQKLYQVILSVCEKEQLQLSDYGLGNLLLHLALAIKRLQLGCQVAALELENTPFYNRARSISLEIIAALTAQIGVSLPDEEAAYIALHLLGKVKGDKDVIGATEILSQQITSALLNLNSLGYELDVEDSILLQGLVEHFMPLLLRLKNGIVLENPLFQEILEHYEQLLKDIRSSFICLPILENYQVSDQEWAYLLLHIQAALERRQTDEAVRVLLVCATGLGSAQLLKNRLKKHFGSQIQICQVLSYHELGHIAFEDIDAIVSTIDLTDQFFPRPVISVNVFLTEQDIEKLESSFNRLKLPRENKNSSLSTELGSAFETCFSSKRFFVYEEAVDKQRIVTDLVASLTQESVKFQEELLRQISLREALGSVVFSQRIAVPHPAKSVANHAEIAVAICKNRVAWEAGHHQVQIIILISPSNFKNKEIRLLTEALFLLIEDDEKQRLLLENPTIEVFKQLICNKLS